MAKLLEEIHPGEILLEDFMKPMGISARQLAADIDVSPSRISELVKGPTAHHGRHRASARHVLRHGASVLVEPAGRIRHAYRRSGTASQALAKDPRLSAGSRLTALR
jgi:hypothetical protein